MLNLQTKQFVLARTQSESILKMSNIIAAAEITNADAIHPGYGFLSENAKFSNLCEEHRIKFIGATGRYD